MLGGWDISGSTNFGPDGFYPTSPDPDTEDRCALVTGLQRHWNLVNGSGAGKAWGGNGFSTTATGLSDAISAGNFVSFSVKAVPGLSLSLTEIGPYNVRRSATGPTSGQWQYSKDGLTFTNIGPVLTWGSVTSSAGNSQSPVDLTAIADLQGISGSTVVVFRLALWGATGSGGTWYLNNWGTPDSNLDFTINGTTAFAPTAAPVEVSGRLVDEGGRGVGNSSVILTSRSGTRFVTRSSPFGYFRFYNVPSGETYVLTVSNKRYEFVPRALNVDDNITDLVLSPVPR
ncbi:MAG: carboxypeptidase regulatory-like domain-containing protein [Acidobacteria bacterium]|nr:carboxypeptidase regulatory-like domain-containing protein [Acidobacteriota bacterium]